MPKKSPYLLTPTARAHLRAAKAWSVNRWGPDLTRAYFEDLDKAARDLASNPRSHITRPELNGGTSLLLLSVREHYLVYERVGADQIVIVAVIRQGRDIPSILRRGRFVIARELEEFRRLSSG